MQDTTHPILSIVHAFIVFLFCCYHYTYFTTMANESDPLVAKHQPTPVALAPLSTRLMDVVHHYWFLGLIAFGGPSAHVAILRDHLCVHNSWIDEEAFMELFALCVGLPGPSSTQLVIATAVTHAGPLGGMIAYVFWNLPGESECR